MKTGIYAFASLFNNREKATAVWLAVGLAWGLLHEHTRHALQEVLRLFFQWKFLADILLMLAYVGLEVFALYRVGFWDVSLLKDTVLWTLGVAFVLLMNSDTSAQDEHYFRKALLDNVKVVAFLEFIVNLYTFNFWLEIALVPVLFLTGAMSAIVETDKKYLPTKKVLGFVQSVFSLCLLAFALVSIVRGFRAFATIGNLKSFLLPIFLTLAYLPFLYANALYMSYEVLFSARLYLCLQDHRALAGYARRKIFGMCSLNLRRLTRFAKDESVAADLWTLKNEDDVLRMIREARMRGL
jgi:hypothetical protein